MASSQGVRSESAALTTKRKRIMIYFIEATQKLIQSEGIDGLSIRKIATEAGYNSATIYNYFQDLEHLTLFASVCYLRDYVIALANSLKPDMREENRRPPALQKTYCRAGGVFVLVMDYSKSAPP